MWVVVASPHWRRGRHRQGDVGLTARATTQECTQIGGNGLSGPFWGICVHCCDAGLGCGWPWDRNSVHKSVEMAPRGRFGAFVYTVGPWAWVVGSLGIAIVYTNGRIGPLRTGLGHLCTLLGCCAVVDRCEDAIVYTNGRIGPLGAVSGRLCTLLRRESRYESRRELRQVARAPQPPRCAGGAPSLAPPAWSGRQALSEWRRCQVSVFAEASTHTNP